MQKEIKQWLGDRTAAVPVVLEAGWVNGLGIIRGLAADGLRCIAISSKSSGMGLHSRTAYGLVCPDPAKEPDQFIIGCLTSNEIESLK
ncbi:MAG TPA: hypothetical protein VHP14_20740 [Anaerolineales bacterium]|nr:hypothetical protein [Anaerolineales bacterium]